MEQTNINWMSGPFNSDYVSAEKHLGLLFKTRKCRKMLRKLQARQISDYPAKNILRASHRQMPDITASDWGHQQQQIRDREVLASFSIGRQNDGSGLIVADAFHRMCALFAEDELIKVPSRSPE